MRCLSRGMYCLVLAVLMVAPLSGQTASSSGLERMMEAGVDAPVLLGNPGVKKEIKLTERQFNDIRTIVREVYEKYQPELRKAGRDQEKVMKIGLESTRETRERLEKALPDILKPEQVKRLQQIQIQVNGIASFKRPEVQKELKLSDRQKEEIASISDGLKRDLGDLAKGSDIKQASKMVEIMRKAKDLKEAATRRAVEKLTDEQQQIWRDLNGPKFDFKPQTR
jgi:hypothetical protein